MSWFARFYDRAMAATEDACLREWRTELLERAHGDVLEIGAGTGVNNLLYPDAVRSVTFCEPDSAMREQLEARLRRDNPRYDVRVVEAVGEDLPFDNAQFDTLVSMLVLCSVDSVERVISELRRVARPGAELLFMEHVAADADTRRRFWQGLIEPAWKRLAGNCHLTRDTAASIGAEFEIQSLTPESMRKAMPLVRPTIRGYATVN